MPQADRPEAAVLAQPENGISAFPIGVQELSTDLRCIHPDQQGGLVGWHCEGGRQCGGQAHVEDARRLPDNLEAVLPRRGVAFPCKDSPRRRALADRSAGVVDRGGSKNRRLACAECGL